MLGNLMQNMMSMCLKHLLIRYLAFNISNEMQTTNGLTQRAISSFETYKVYRVSSSFAWSSQY